MLQIHRCGNGVRTQGEYLVSRFGAGHTPTIRSVIAGASGQFFVYAQVAGLLRPLAQPFPRSGYVILTAYAPDKFGCPHAHDRAPVLHACPAAPPLRNRGRPRTSRRSGNHSLQTPQQSRPRRLLELQRRHLHQSHRLFGEWEYGDSHWSGWSADLRQRKARQSPQLRRRR